MIDIRTKLSTLWIFAALNYLYCDVVGLMDHELLAQFLTGKVDGLEFTQGFLLGAAMLVEIPIAMVVVSRLASKHGFNRWSNIIAAAIMTVVQFATLFAGAPTPYYAFFSVIEIACTSAIFWYSFRWRALVVSAPEAIPGGEASLAVRDA